MPANRAYEALLRLWRACDDLAAGGFGMAVTVSLAREMALKLEGASAAPHFHRIAFRTPRKTFATLDGETCDMNLMFDPELRDFFCEQEPEAFRPVAGGWGRMGATRCDLAAVDASTLRSALETAHRLAAPKVGHRR